MLLSGSGNTYGAMTVSLGVLRLGHAAALSDTASGTTVTSGAVLALSGFSVGAEALTIAGSGYGGSGTITGVGAVSS